MRLNICAFACVGGLTFGPTVRADDVPSDDPPAPDPPGAPTPTIRDATPVPATTYNAQSPGQYSYSWREPQLYSEIGIGVSVGGGVTGFTSSLMRDATSAAVGGLWDVRVSFGTHIPFGVEASYVGTAANVETFSGISNGTLIGTTVEGMLRYNILPHYWLNPYLFAGVGWQRYDLTGLEIPMADSGMKNDDDLAVVPMGAGLSMRHESGFTFDLRATFRAASTSDLLIDEFGEVADLHTWEANGSLGYEF